MVPGSDGSGDPSSERSADPIPSPRPCPEDSRADRAPDLLPRPRRSACCPKPRPEILPHDVTGEPNWQFSVRRILTAAFSPVLRRQVLYARPFPFPIVSPKRSLIHYYNQQGVKFQCCFVHHENPQSRIRSARAHSDPGKTGRKQASERSSQRRSPCRDGHLRFSASRGPPGIPAGGPNPSLQTQVQARFLSAEKSFGHPGLPSPMHGLVQRPGREFVISRKQ